MNEQELKQVINGQSQAINAQTKAMQAMKATLTDLAERVRALEDWAEKQGGQSAGKTVDGEVVRPDPQPDAEDSI